MKSSLAGALAASEASRGRSLQPLTSVNTTQSLSSEGGKPKPSFLCVRNGTFDVEAASGMVAQMVPDEIDPGSIPLCSLALSIRTTTNLTYGLNRLALLIVCRARMLPLEHTARCLLAYSMHLANSLYLPRPFALCIDDFDRISIDHNKVCRRTSCRLFSEVEEETKEVKSASCPLT